MGVVSFLHQKGGTGKSTLAIASALCLAGRGEKVILVDADSQGTSAEWANRFGHRFGVESLSQIQPVLEEDARRLSAEFAWVVIDSPPSLSPITQSVLQAGGRLIIPIRPAWPDVWALPWVAAIVKKLRRDRYTLDPLVVFNQHQGESLSPFLAQIAPWNLPVSPTPIPYHPAFAALFEGQPLPADLTRQVLTLVGAD